MWKFRCWVRLFKFFLCLAAVVTCSHFYTTHECVDQKKNQVEWDTSKIEKCCSHLIDTRCMLDGGKKWNIQGEEFEKLNLLLLSLLSPVPMSFEFFLWLWLTHSLVDRARTAKHKDIFVRIFGSWDHRHHHGAGQLSRSLLMMLPWKIWESFSSPALLNTSFCSSHLCGALVASLVRWQSWDGWPQIIKQFFTCSKTLSWPVERDAERNR